jgi:membrane protease YdiL (CAAX protease family)
MPEAVAALRPPPPPAPPEREGPWLHLPVWVPFATLGAAAIAVLVVSALVAAVVFAIDPGAADETPQWMIIALTIVQDALLVGAAVWAVRRVLRRVTPAMFGLRPAAVGSALGWTAAIYGGFWFASAVLLAIFGAPPDQEIVRDLKETEALGILFGFAVLTCVVAPLAEELFFRGFMFSALAARIGVWASALVTGTVFGLIHLSGSPLLGVLVLSVFGVGLCLLYWKTASLLPCLALHAAHNGISFGITKSLPWWGVLALAAASVAVVLTVASLVAARARPAAPG